MTWLSAHLSGVVIAIVMMTVLVLGLRWLVRNGLHGFE